MRSPAKTNQSNKPAVKETNMVKCKALSKKTRFEVFKRDNFICQYCGAGSPDVILHVDHIAPIAGGGDNDIMNLITSCSACNFGKGARELDDTTVIAKQKAQLQELNQRREQLEMLLSWREGLSNLSQFEVDAINDIFLQKTGYNLSEHGRSGIMRMLKKNTASKIIETLDESLDYYYKDGSSDEDEDRAMASKAISMLGRIINAKKRYADKPYMKDLFYLRGIVRNRHFCNDVQAIILLEQAYLAGIHLDDLRELSTTSQNWTVWRETLSAWIADEQGGD